MNRKQIISFMNMKGGVAKTTLCINIANTLSSQFDRKILLIDMDPQFNATQSVLSIVNNDYMEFYDSTKKNKKTIYYLFSDSHRNSQINSQNKASTLFNSNNIRDFYLEDDYIINIKENFDMILGDIDLIELQIIQKEGIENRLDKYIKKNNLKSHYDYILIDCPPTYSSFLTSAYRASDTYIIPVKPDLVSSLGLSLLTKAINSIENTEKLGSSGIIFTLTDKNSTTKKIIDEIIEDCGKENIFNTEIRNYATIKNAAGNRKFMLDIEKSNIKNSIIKITEEFISRMGGVI